jgi:hypothetical protein
LGPFASYKILVTPRLTYIDQQVAIAGILLTTFAFNLDTLFTFKILLIEHLDLMNTDEYEMLDKYVNL